MWERVKKSDAAAVALANRHYSRQLFGKAGTMLGPPGRLICFATPTRDAVWVSHWPYADLALDRLDAFRCTMFRNEGPSLSSALIREAMEKTEAIWGPLGRPENAWKTWVAVDHVESDIAGYCFRRAGWHRDREWIGTRKDTRLIRLRAQLRTTPWPESEPGVDLQIAFDL